MVFKARSITVEISESPASAKKRIRALMKKHNGNRHDVAADLGVSYRSLDRYLTKLGMKS